MQKDHHDKENQVPSIQLDFKKKCKPKPNSDRTYSNPNIHKIQNTNQISVNTITLLQKKKQYALTIRQKNLKKQGKKQQLGDIVEENTHIEHQNDSNILKISNTNPCHPCHFYSVNNTKEQTLRTKRTQSVFKPNQLKTQSKVKCRSAKKQKAKMKQITMIFQGVNENNFNDQGLNMTINQNYMSEQLCISPDYSVILNKNDGTENINKYQILSKEVDQSFGPFVTEQIKEIELLRKQNNTFKKELANFRKENSSLKRDYEELKKQLRIVQERNQYLQGQSSDQLKLLESFQIKVGQSFDCLPDLEQPAVKHELNAQECDDTLKKIIGNYQNELFNATNLNKKLQFKNYMLQKRLMDETESHKKKMAKEISIWKERYIKARNQNLKLKDSRSQLLFEMSISQQM